MSRAIKIYEVSYITPEGKKLNGEIKSNGTPDVVKETLKGQGLKHVKVREVTEQEIIEDNSEYYNKVLSHPLLRVKAIQRVMELLAELAAHDAAFIESLIEYEKREDYTKFIGDVPVARAAAELSIASLQCLLDIHPRILKCREDSLAITDKTFKEVK